MRVVCRVRLSSSFRSSALALGTLAVGGLFGGAAFALSTGVPVSFTVDPSTVRQRQKDTSAVTATVTLESPSPTFFICELRSADPRKLSFPTIIFRKGDIRQQTQGVANWKFVRKDARIRVTAYSVDAPDRQLSFTVALKPKAAEETDVPTPQ